MLSSSVLICTFNRATLLQDTLECLCRVRSMRHWEVVIVDNNSADDTKVVIERFQGRLPVPLLYVFEPRQGKSFALNTGLEQSHGDLILFTDDDVLIPPQWVEAASSPLENDPTLGYTGGPVRPLWGGSRPPWLDESRSELWGTLAILDYGSTPFVFEDRARVPLGANMAVRRALIDQVGGFHPDLGRRGGSLIGQEQSEFFARSRKAGARGLYVPAMELQHHVPSSRMTKQYFRRWWFWKGVSRALIDSTHKETELGLDLTKVPHIARVPRFVWGSLPRLAAAWLRARVAGDGRAAVRHQMAIFFAVGYIRACWTRGALKPVDPLRRGAEPASCERA